MPSLILDGCKARSETLILESSKTMKSVYAEYCKVMESLSRSMPALQQPCQHYSNHALTD